MAIINERDEKYTITNGTLTDIADAIRSKTGGTEKIAAEDMAAEIEAIPAPGLFIDGDGAANTSAFKFSSANFGNNAVTFENFTAMTGNSTQRTLTTITADSITVNVGRIAQYAMANIYVRDFVKFTANSIENQACNPIKNANEIGSEKPIYIILDSHTYASNCIWFSDPLYPLSTTSAYIVCIAGQPLTMPANALNKNAYTQGTIDDLYVSWSEGEVDNAPWGLSDAVIHYNTTFDDNGMPII